MIIANNLNLSFGEKIIFEDLNFAIEEGQNICFSGESGRGKSTLLKMFQAYTIAQKGEIIINDLDVSPENARNIRKQITWIPQNINLAVKNGAELVELMDISSKKGEIIELCIKLGLEDNVLQQDFNKISGGQKQRLVIAICLSNSKDIILMDEPTSSLDDKSIMLLIDLIKSYQGKTIISASHNALWLNNADKIIEL